MVKEKEKYGIGKRFTTNEGYEVEIVEKLENAKRRIKFENGYEIEVFVYPIRIGAIKNPYHPSSRGVGYLGVGEYKADINGKRTLEYSTWTSMLNRCYDEKYQEKCPTYKSVAVCKEWMNFQNFAKWYEDNYPKIEDIKFHLDKDLLQENIKNKIYSPDTCTFLPHNVNLFLDNKQSNNTSGYIGVSWFKRDKKWEAQINLFGEERKQKHLGLFTTPEQASESYQEARGIESEKVKNYLRSLNYLSEEVINLIK